MGLSECSQIEVIVWDCQSAVTTEVIMWDSQSAVITEVIMWDCQSAVITAVSYTHLTLPTTERV